jgi:ribosomal protein L5
VLPRINDFKGFTRVKPLKSNNISIGVNDLTVFPQINANLRYFVKRLGCTLTFCIKTKNLLARNLIMNEFQIPKIK